MEPMPSTTTWIICGGQPRAALDGRVACPLRGAGSSLEQCASCRHLEWWQEERARGPACEALAPLSPSASRDPRAATGAGRAA